MWMLTWTQDCSLVAFDTDALDDLLSIVSTDDDGTETGVEIVRTTELEGATP
jgi:hypothetical protein